MSRRTIKRGTSKPCKADEQKVSDLAFLTARIGQAAFFNLVASMNYVVENMRANRKVKS